METVAVPKIDEPVAIASTVQFPGLEPAVNSPVVVFIDPFAVADHVNVGCVPIGFPN
jgi:hypothetical protein